MRQTGQVFGFVSVFDGTRSRLVRTLCSLAVSHGEPAQGPSAMVLRVTQEEVAAILGVSRQTINKELKALESEGALESLA